MSPWWTFSVLVCWVGTVVSGGMEETRGTPRNPMETLTSCNISLDCNIIENGVVCHLTKEIQGQLTRYRLNSRGAILFQLMKGTEDGTEQKKMETKTDSCQMRGYGKVFSHETPLLFVYHMRGHARSIFFYEKHNLTKKHKVNLDFERAIDYLYADMIRCTFLWIYRTHEKHIYSSISFDGKDRKRIFEGKTLCVFYDHLRQLNFLLTFRKRSYVLMVFNRTQYISDIFETKSILYCKCCSGHATSQTLVMCIKSGDRMYYTLHTLNYSNMSQIVPRKVFTLRNKHENPYVAFVPPNKLTAVQYETDTAYLFDIESQNQSNIFKCPFRSYYYPLVGYWNSQVYIKCTDTKYSYFYFVTQDGVKTMHIKTGLSTRMVSGLA